MKPVLRAEKSTHQFLQKLYRKKRKGMIARSSQAMKTICCPKNVNLDNENCCANHVQVFSPQEFVFAEFKFLKVNLQNPIQNLRHPPPVLGFQIQS